MLGQILGERPCVVASPKRGYYIPPRDFAKDKRFHILVKHPGISQSENAMHGDIEPSKMMEVR